MIRNNTYCVEMRQAFQGIKIAADSMVADQITKQLEILRRAKYVSNKPPLRTSGKIQYPYKSYKVGGTQNRDTSSMERKLHWTIRQCNSPSNNWYICEKSVNVDTNQAKKHYTKYNSKRKSNGNKEDDQPNAIVNGGKLFFCRNICKH